MRKFLATLLVLTIISGLVCVPVMAQQTDLERVQELIDSLPDSYKVVSYDVSLKDYKVNNPRILSTKERSFNLTYLQGALKHSANFYLNKVLTN